MQTKYNIAIYCIDDDKNTLATLAALFKRNGIINYTMYSNPTELLAALHEDVQICIIDYDLKNAAYNGLTLMKEILKRNKYCKFFIMSGYDDLEMVINFWNSGASKYLRKADKKFSEKLIEYINEEINIIAETVKHNMKFLKDFSGVTDELKELRNGKN